MPSLDTLRELAAILASAATLVAACVAVFGINSWRRQLKAKEQVPLAENVLELFYQAHYAITTIRNPWSFAEEGSSRKPLSGETQEEREARNSVYFVFSRYEKQRELFGRLSSLRYRFMVHFGRDAAAPFSQLDQILSNIFLAAHRQAQIRADFATNKYSGEKEIMKKLDQESKDCELTIYYTGGKDDRVEQELETPA